MTINPLDTVKHLALSVPVTTRIFEQFGIDYCCGGNRTLEEACRNASLSLPEVVHSIEEAAGPGQAVESDWRHVALTALASHIVENHHTFTRQEITRLEKLFEKACFAHAKNHPELLRLHALFEILKQDLLPHMLKEEQVLFPYIGRLEEAVNHKQPVSMPFFGSVNNPVRMMMAEHDTAGDLLRDMRAIAKGYELPADACATFQTLYSALQEFEADLHQHIHLENNLLFPRAIEIENAINPGWQAKAIKTCIHHCSISDTMRIKS